MIRQISILTKAQICNFASINVLRFTKDKKKRATMLALLPAWMLLIGILCFYVGSIAVGYIKMGLGDVVPMYLAAISSIIILIFGILKAGSVLFQKEAYETLCAMPVCDTAIVVSRFLSMYLGNFLLSLLVMIPGMAVYGYLLKPGIGFYLTGVVGTLFLPLLPMTVATLIGAVVTAIAARMKRKSLVTVALTLGFVALYMLLMQNLTKIEGEITEEMMLRLSEVVTGIIENMYPPAVWLGRTMVAGSVSNGLLYLGVSIALFVFMVVVVKARYKQIYARLYSVSAKHDFKIKTLQKKSVLATLYKREWKRYFASSIYVTNTIIGPIMMVALAVALIFAGTEQIEAILPERAMIIGLIPFVLSACACLGTTTSVSVSMEGKQWWIVKSLPVSTKVLFDSKILLNLSLVAPFYVLAEIIALLVLRPPLVEGIWFVVLPALFILFSSVFGITANLWFPVFNWENEVNVVKQSAATLVGSMFGSLLVVLFAAPLFFAPLYMWNVIRLVIALVVLATTIGMYKRNSKVKLTSIG